MNKRTLRKLMAEGNLKSPEIITALAYPGNNWDAAQVAGIFLDCTGYKLPFSFDNWQRTVKTPCELYFVFEKKKQLVSFLRIVRRKMPHLETII